MAFNKYSVILMRDDHTVRHYHFHSIWLRIILWTVFVILTVSVTLGYVSVKLWIKTSHLKELNQQQAIQIQKKTVRLNRLENIEKVVAYRDPDQLEKLITGQLTNLYAPESTSKVDLREFYRSFLAEHFSIDNLKVNTASSNTLRLHFDLKNLVDDKVLRGKADVQLLTNDAKLIETGLTDNNQLFQITNYKTFSSTIHLPDGFDSNDIFALRIIISGPQGKMLYGKTFRLDALTS